VETAREQSVASEPASVEARVGTVAPAAAPFTPGRVLALQRAAGNAAVTALLRGRRLQRKIEAADLPTRTAAQIMGDETYIDNQMASLRFFGAEQATITYKDGATLTIGLVPEWINPPNPPIEAVNYRSTGHSRVDTGTSGELGFIPNAQETIMKAPDTMPFGELLKQLGRTVTFKHDPKSGRIVPTEVNMVTAPRLCQVLREAEAEYVRDFDAFAKGGEKVMKKIEIAVILASLLPAGGAAAGAARGGGAAAEAAAAGARAESKLLGFIRGLLKGSKGAQIAVEGVELGGVEAGIQGQRLFVRYSHIINSGQKAGYGRMVQSALERAAMAAGKEAGAKTVEVGVTTIVNPKWQAYLESLGYVAEMVPMGTTWTKVWMRVFTL
jgi:hypothetical protein